jgi:hypothetical protein
MEYTQDQVNAIVAEAKSEAFKAADNFFQTRLGGRDQMACGFGVKGNTRLGRMLKTAGLRKSYSGGLQIWNPANYGCQNVDTLEAGAEAAAKIFEKYGFRAYAGSRLD